MEMTEHFEEITPILKRVLINHRMERFIDEFKPKLFIKTKVSEKFKFKHFFLHEKLFLEFFQSDQ